MNLYIEFMIKFCHYNRLHSCWTDQILIVVCFRFALRVDMKVVNEVFYSCTFSVLINYVVLFG